MKKSRFLSLMFLLSFVASPIFGGTVKVEAQSAQPAQVAAINPPQQVQSSAPNDEIGTSNTTGQMRTTTMAMRIAAAAHLNLARSGSVNRYAGINPDTSQMSPLANLGGQLAQMVESLALPDYFGVANWANSPLPQLDVSGNVIGGIHKFTTALPTFCPLGQNALGQCIPVAVPDTTTFANSEYYEIAVV